MKKLAFIGLCLSLGSCLLYKKPTEARMDALKESSRIGEHVSVPDDWIMARDSGAVFTYAWIQELGRPELMTLIQEGLAHNADILIASEKLDQVEIAMGLSGGNLYPSVDAVAGGIMNTGNANQLGSLKFKANWELDLWGKNKSAYEADQRAYFSAYYTHQRLKESIAALIAKAYFLDIAGQVQEDKMKAYLAKTEEIKSILELKKKVGTANDLDLSNVQAEIIMIQNQLEQIRNANIQAKRSLELLLGRYPKGMVDAGGAFPEIKNKVPETFPLRMLENRSDILAYHYQIEQAFLEVQEAKAARLPSLNISSSFGVAGSNVQAVNSLFSNPVVNVGGGIASPLFHGGQLQKNVDIKTSAQQQMVEEYARAVLNALNEVEASWGNLHSYETQIGYVKSAIAELEKGIALTQKQIDIGMSNNFFLFQKQRDLIKNEMGLSNLELQYIVERINLFMALGGSSSISEVPKP